jgi:ribosomal protein S18 acetylase RimI-like enzyme
MSNIAVHQATIFDLELLVPLFDAYRQFNGRDSDIGGAREFLRARLNYGESTLFIALDDDKPVGFAQLYASFSSVSMRRTFSMNDLYVDRHARRKGTALRLMTAAVDYASAVGAEKMSLRIAPDNHAALALYTSTGWEPEEQYQVFCFMVPELIVLN